MAISAAPQKPARRERVSASSLRRRVLLTVGTSALVLLGAVLVAGTLGIQRIMGARADARLHDIAHRGALLVDRMLVERERETTALATDPLLVDAARAGAVRAQFLRLPSQSVAVLEQRYDALRSLDVDPRTRLYLLGLGGEVGVVEAMLTDRYGYNVVTTDRTSDFVQSDEPWWQTAWQQGKSPDEVDLDASANQITITMSRAVREGADQPPVGVLKVSYDTRAANDALVKLSEGQSVRLDLVDAAGRVLASSGESPSLRPLAGFDSLRVAGADSLATFASNGAEERAAVAAVHDGAWLVVAHAPRSVLMADARHLQLLLVAGAVFTLILLLAGLGLVSGFLSRHITGPAARLAQAAESVAQRDLTGHVEVIESDDEIGRLSRATSTMIDELRRLAEALHSSSRETSTMAGEIGASAEEMAASAQQMAETSSALSQQSAEMAETIQHLSGDATKLVGIAGSLDAGAAEGVERNARLRTLATENRERLDASAAALGILSEDVRASATAIETLAAGSEEIRAFVTFVQKMARQSKLLALNAAMEAARAGEQGQGFAVVANEVRRLAAGANQQAERVEALVSELLARVELSRTASGRTVDTVQQVLDATQESSSSFGLIEQAVLDTEAWTGSIRAASEGSSALIREMTERIESLAHGTESFAAAMQEVAASSQEQSASTEEIAAAATHLAQAAERLLGLVRTFRLESVGVMAPGDAGVRAAQPVELSTGGTPRTQAA